MEVEVSRGVNLLFHDCNRSDPSAPSEELRSPGGSLDPCPVARPRPDCSGGRPGPRAGWGGREGSGAAQLGGWREQRQSQGFRLRQVLIWRWFRSSGALTGTLPSYSETPFPSWLFLGPKKVAGEPAAPRPQEGAGRQTAGLGRGLSPSPAATVPEGKPRPGGQGRVQGQGLPPLASPPLGPSVDRSEQTWPGPWDTPVGRGAQVGAPTLQEV